MYLINTELTVNWYLLTGDSPPALAALDIRIVPPNGEASYVSGGILADDYTESTADTKGLVVYRFTPDELGLWTIGLSEGISSDNTDFYTHSIMVSTNDIYTQKYVKSSLL